MLPAWVIAIADMSVRISWNKGEKFLKLVGGVGNSLGFNQRPIVHLPSGFTQCMPTEKDSADTESDNKKEQRQTGGRKGRRG